MTPVLLLCGEIGCGKSTLIRNALGEEARQAGGFVTLRCLDGDKLLGFDLAPGSALVDKSAPRQRFLDFTCGKKQNDNVFADFGAELLKKSAPFALADEFGGLELLIPEFREGLEALLTSGTPVVGVFKTDKASLALARRVELDSRYREEYLTFRQQLQQNPRVTLLPTSGRGDEDARLALEQWVSQYVRK